MPEKAVQRLPADAVPDARPFAGLMLSGKSVSTCAGNVPASCAFHVEPASSCRNARPLRLSCTPACVFPSIRRFQSGRSAALRVSRAFSNTRGRNTHVLLHAGEKTPFPIRTGEDRSEGLRHGTVRLSVTSAGLTAIRADGPFRIRGVGSRYFSFAGKRHGPRHGGGSSSVRLFLSGRGRVRRKACSFNPSRLFSPYHGSPAMGYPREASCTRI